MGLAVARRQRLGFDDGRERWTLPVYESGTLVNVRRYDPSAPKGVGKMKNAAGHGEARLYIAETRRRRLAETVLVCEGEWDALAAASHGLRAVSGTAGADTWRPAWSQRLAARDVVIVFDCDEAGRAAAAKRAANVAEHGASVRVVDLDPERDDKWDLSDWFAEGRTARDLLALADSVEPLGESRGGRRGTA